MAAAAAANVGFGGRPASAGCSTTRSAAQISWLLPAALSRWPPACWLTDARRAPTACAPRYPLGRLAAGHGAVFSYMSGIVHPYYTVALAPAIAALVAIGGRESCGRPVRTIVARGSRSPRASLGTGVWGYCCSTGAPTGTPRLRIAVVAAAVIAAALLLLGPLVARRRPLSPSRGRRRHRDAGSARGVCTADGLDPTHRQHPDGGPLLRRGGFAGRAAAARRAGSARSSGGTPPSAPWEPPPASEAASACGHGARWRRQREHERSARHPAESRHDPPLGRATVGSQSAAPLELASGQSVIAIGGFSGSDPAPTLAQFKALVANGEIHYFLAGGRGGRAGGGSASAIASLGRSHFTSQDRRRPDGLRPHEGGIVSALDLPLPRRSARPPSTLHGDAEGLRAAGRAPARRARERSTAPAAASLTSSELKALNAGAGELRSPSPRALRGAGRRAARRRRDGRSC